MTATHERASLAAGARPLRVLMVAGEASGDMHGADLVEALRARVGAVEVVGVGGAKLQRAGMTAMADSAELARVGLVEASRGLRQLWRTYRALRDRIRDDPPDVCVLIDFPDFNLRLARAAKRSGVPVLYYIGPQVWAWRRRRVRTIGRSIDRLAVVFPFEAALYRPWLHDVHFVGHPLIDRVQATRGREATLSAEGLDPARRTLVLLPGSRRSEIRYMLPPFAEAARRLREADPSLQVVLALAEAVDRAGVADVLAASGTEATIVDGGTYDLMAAADLALVTSGTATLECALLGCPMVIAYRLSPLTAMLGRLLIRGVSHIGLPNIVAGREIVPELIQGEATGAGIAAAAAPILHDQARRARMVDELRDVRERLGTGGAAARVAELALDLVASRREAR